MKQDESARRVYIDRLSTLLDQERIDWDRFIKLVTRHRVHALAYQNIKQHAPDLFPPSVTKPLKTQSAQKRRHQLNLTAELIRLVKLFEQHDILALSFKGPILSQQLFNDVGLRYSKDLDLLVRLEDLDQAEGLLLAQGYQRQQPNFVHSPRQKQAFLARVEHYTYHKDSYQVELHWRFFSNPHFLASASLQAMLAQTQPFSTANTRCQLLTNDAQFFYLCLHGADHGWERLKWLCDIGQFLHQPPEIDWQVWSDKVCAQALHRPVAQALLMAHQLFDAPLPPIPRILRRDTNVVADMVSYAKWRLIQSEEALWGVDKFKAFRNMAYRLRLKPDIRYQWAQVSTMWHSLDDWNQYPLPDAVFPLYPAVRVFSWLKRHYLTNRSANR